MGLELKQGDQVIFLVDRSGSMATSDCDGDTRYNAVRETIKAFVRSASKYDPDGVSIHFFNNRVETHNDVATPDAVDKLIDAHSPGGGTNTDLAIQAAWKEHKAKISTASYVIVFTDGEPTDQSAVEKTIANITQTMTNPEEFRLLFLTVGERSAQLSAWLTRLDSALPGAKYDIVGVEELAGVDFEQATADLIGSTTTTGDAAAGNSTGKTTVRI